MVSVFDSVPVLQEWVSLPEAAKLIGISRQAAHKRIERAVLGKRGGWKTIHRLGENGIYVVRRAEVLAEAEARKAREDKLTSVVVDGKVNHGEAFGNDS